jgi:hypothetical protein
MGLVVGAVGFGETVGSLKDGFLVRDGSLVDGTFAGLRVKDGTTLAGLKVPGSMGTGLVVGPGDCAVGPLGMGFTVGPPGLSVMVETVGSSDIVGPTTAGAGDEGPTAGSKVGKGAGGALGSIGILVDPHLIFSFTIVFFRNSSRLPDDFLLSFPFPYPLEDPCKIPFPLQPSNEELSSPTDPFPRHASTDTYSYL